MSSVNWQWDAPRQEYYYYLATESRYVYASEVVTNIQGPVPQSESFTPIWDPVPLQQYQDAQQVWRDVFQYMAYTNFSQIQYLVRKAGVSWDNVLRGPKLLSRRITREEIEADKSYPFTQTWAKAGRCTSFAVLVVRRLGEMYGSAYDFEYFDLGGHRVARCTMTGILIDSSSQMGAIPLIDGEWNTIEGDSKRWKWSIDKAQFEAEPVSKEESESEEKSEFKGGSMFEGGNAKLVSNPFFRYHCSRLNTNFSYRN